MRPKVICHMVSSIDGRLQVDRWTPPASGQSKGRLHAHYEEVAARFDADGWLVGRITMERHYAEARIPAGRPGDGPRETHIANRCDRRLAIVLDPHGKLHYGRDEVDGNHLVAVLGWQVSDDYLAQLRADGVSYLFAGPEGKDLHRVLEVLGAAFGVKTLLLEGGGIVNGSFLKAGLIDEISLLIYPGIDGLAGISSIFETPGDADDRPAAGRALRHTATEMLEGGMAWLRYRLEDAPG